MNEFHVPYRFTGYELDSRLVGRIGNLVNDLNHAFGEARGQGLVVDIKVIDDGGIPQIDAVVSRKLGYTRTTK